MGFFLEFMPSVSVTAYRRNAFAFPLCQSASTPRRDYRPQPARSQILAGIHLAWLPAELVKGRLKSLS